jgi:hypothetical protein
MSEEDEENLSSPEEGSVDPELVDLIRSVAMTLMEPTDQLLAYHAGALNYYDRVCKHICTQDTETMRTILYLTIHLRKTYHTFMEYKKMVETVPVTKGTEESEGTEGSEASEESICPVCHDSLDSWKHVIRLRALDGNPRTCGHAMHRSCAVQLRPTPNGMLSCPVCRAELGASLAFWLDVRHRIPEY